MRSHITGQVNLPCLKAKEAAEYLGIPQKLLWDLKMAKAIPYFQLRPGCEIFYPIIGLSPWLENNRPHFINGGRR